MLVADGFAPVRRRLADALTAQGFTVYEAVSTADAFRVMTSAGIPESFVVDGHLANGQGMKFAQSLGTLDKTRACPVVLLMNNAAALERAGHQGLHHAVQPMVRYPLLEKLVASVLERLGAGAPPGPSAGLAAPDVALAAAHADELRALENAYRLFEGIVQMVRDDKLPGPLIPELLREVMTLLADPDVSFPKLAQFVGRQQAIAARILAVANSVYYMRATARVTSLQVAIARLGQRETSRLLQGVASRAYVVGKDPALRALIAESLDMGYVVALAADQLARQGRPPHQGDVYTVGLFHNVGQTFLYYTLALLKDQKKVGDLDLDVLRTLAASRSAQLNALMCEHMRLPYEIVAVYASTSRPEVSEATIAVIHQAMWVGDRLLRRRSADDLVLDSDGELLGLTDEAVDRLRETAPQILAMLDACGG